MQYKDAKDIGTGLDILWGVKRRGEGGKTNDETGVKSEPDVGFGL
jgi:hypothetical protein